ncbi:hypothetical protein B0I32_105417 [Nonomuraea fuscirosea]|uniref:Uncharacterized protein n=1 Tax=Nonomuraea fuscirosea TaxID=1291556 RepID=A0A2T0N4G2_9ACTN|nr:hypothetical protein [Nonomuraea fuscirosea]PRX66977.1 hypothetical protein B0I32_105417 [Nonomuraea fuscirosea]
MTFPGPEPRAPFQGRIGLWGAPQSGKTTFLAALRVAVDQGESDWWLHGSNDASTDFLTDMTHQLITLRQFPAATLNLPPNLQWVFRGEREVRRRTRFGLTRTEREVTAIMLDLLDAPGGMYRGDSRRSNAAPSGRVQFHDDDGADAGDGRKDLSEEERLIDHLVSCDGLIYLFDPTRERSRRDSYDYFQRTVMQLAQRAAGRSRDRFLPHHLAVCITKFDHPYVYEPAHRLGYADNTTKDEGFPTVPDALAAELFSVLCASDVQNSAVLLDKGIRTSFSPDRTRYFMTSAVGFYLDPKVRRFQPAQPWNVVEETGPEGDTTRILGGVHPINVIEPLVWLATATLPRS